MVVSCSRLQLLDVGRRQLRPVDGQRQLVEFAGESERTLVVLIVYRCAGVAADIEVLILLQDERQGVFHGLGSHRGAVNLQRAPVPPGRCHSCC